MHIILNLATVKLHATLKYSVSGVSVFLIK